MSRIAMIEPDTAEGRAQELLTDVKAALGLVPNMTKAMASSPALLQGYLTLSGALGAGEFDAGTRELIAITVAEANGCSYCLSAHSYIGEHVAKLDADTLEQARDAASSDSRTAAVLELAEAVVRHRGHVDDPTFARARAAGLTDSDIAETVGHVALNVLTNLFNSLVQVDNDWPVLSPRNAVA